MKKLILIPTVIFTTLVFTNCKKTADLAPTRNLRTHVGIQFAHRAADERAAGEFRLRDHLL